MHTIMDTAGAIFQCIVVILLLKVVVLAFLQTTLLGRLILGSLKNGSKIYKACSKGAIKLSKIMIKEAKSTYNCCKKYVNNYEKRADTVLNNKMQVVNGGSVVNLAEYIQERKSKSSNLSMDTIK